MSDLQCPARIFIARHGDATYGGAHGVLTMHPGELTDKGVAQVTAMAHSLEHERIAAVYSSHVHRAIQSGHTAAAALGLENQIISGVHEYEVGSFDGVPYADERVQALFDAWVSGDLDQGFPDGETGRHIVERYREALNDLADRHRGESVLVMSHGGVMSLAIPHLGRNVRNDLARQSFVPNAVPALVAVDSDGFEIVSWPGVLDD